MANHLVDSASDYLRSHADQLVNWWEWGNAAFAEAQRREVPILLSVGYASCHWCHVMSDESFNDPSVATKINDHFVPIKVDRQQLPDVDAVYMTVTQAMNDGVGGWPMTLFLTPEGAPFFAGTYFPAAAGPRQPSFGQLLDAMALAWENRRDQCQATADYVAEQLAAVTISVEDDAPDLRAVIEQVEQQFDLIHGGFGQAPKFPAPTLLDALLVKGDPKAMELAQRTLEAMARGGIYDQVGGGFHRYAVDAGWVVPHFEKMLYDNGLLLGAYVRGWRRTPDHDGPLRALFERTAYGIVEFLAREMTTDQGAFGAGLDADSADIRGEVHEGIFYLWSPELLLDALGEEDAHWAGDTFHVTTGGTFEHGLSTLQLRGRPDWVRLQKVCDRLLEERGHRAKPAADRLVVAAWNGWTISSLVWGAMVFNEPEWLAMATRAAEYLARVHLVDGTLRRSSFEGSVSSAEGSAEDYGAVAEAFSLLAGVTGDAIWLDRAVGLLERAVPLFGAADGGFFDAADLGLLHRPRSVTDNVTPSGTASLLAALRHVGLLAERPDFIRRADDAARTLYAVVGEAPITAGSALADLLVEDEARRGLKQAVVVVVTDDPFDELARAAWRLAPAGSAVLAVPSGAVGWGKHLAGRDHRAVWVCRGTVCFDPVDNYRDLKTPLWHRA